METKLKNVKTMLGELCDISSGNDSLGVHEMLIDVTVANIEVILQIKRYVIPKIHSMTSAFNAVKLDLDAAKEELKSKEEELKDVKICSKCHSLEKELILQKKKQAVNESRIKSIAKILTRCIPDSQDVDNDSGTDSDESTVTRAYNLVSQVLGCEAFPSTGSNCEMSRKVQSNKKLTSKKSPLSSKNTDPCSDEKKISRSSDDSKEEGDSVDDVLVCSIEDFDKENGLGELVSPKKINKSKSPANSPVIGKIKKTPLRGVTESPSSDCCKRILLNDEIADIDYENSFCIPPSPGNIKSSRNVITPQILIQTAENKKETFAEPQKKDIQLDIGRSKKTADFWELKPTNFVDQCSVSSKKDGVKLRQAKLSLGCLPKKRDLCDLEEFNGGIRKSQTSTQISQGKTEDNIPTVPKTNVQIGNLKAEDFREDDDVIMESPVTNVFSTKRKGGRIFGLGRKLSYDATRNNAPGTSQNKNPTSCSLDNQKILSKDNQEIWEEEKGIDNSFDCIKKGTLSPNYKYRGGPVRKKSERQKLSGWDCDNCRKYYEAAGGENASEEELKKLMDRCSRHRDKNPLRARTPPGFWDAEFPCTADCKDLDQTYVDILPLSKKQKKM